MGSSITPVIAFYSGSQTMLSLQKVTFEAQVVVFYQFDDQISLTIDVATFKVAACRLPWIPPYAFLDS